MKHISPINSKLKVCKVVGKEVLYKADDKLKNQKGAKMKNSIKIQNGSETLGAFIAKYVSKKIKNFFVGHC